MPHGDRHLNRRMSGRKRYKNRGTKRVASKPRRRGGLFMELEAPKTFPFCFSAVGRASWPEERAEAESPIDSFFIPVGSLSILIDSRPSGRLQFSAPNGRLLRISPGLVKGDDVAHRQAHFTG